MCLVQRLLCRDLRLDGLIVGVVYVVAVYLILQSKIVDIKFGESAAAGSDAIYLVASFLCGFSERFAKDIFARLPFGDAKNQ